MGEIVFNAEREVVGTRAAMMVVIERAISVTVVVMIVRSWNFRLAAAITMMGTRGGFVRAEDTRVESGEHAEDQKPCEKCPHQHPDLARIRRDFKEKSTSTRECTC